MKSPQVVAALAALAHAHRLAVYRLLVERGPHGCPAGMIAQRVGLLPSSLTFHVQALRRSGLIRSRRVGRQVFYAADFDAMNALVGYLTENCCGQGSGASAPACRPASSAGKGVARAGRAA